MAPHALRSIIACLVAGVVAASHNKTVLIVGDSWVRYIFYFPRPLLCCCMRALRIFT